MTQPIELTFKREAGDFSRYIDPSSDGPADHSKAQGLIARHATSVQRHLRVLLADVPDEEVERVYEQAIRGILAASARGDEEQPTDEFAEVQHVKPDIEPLGDGYMQELDEDEQEERERLEDAQARVGLHNRRMRERSKRR